MPGHSPSDATEDDQQSADHGDGDEVLMPAAALAAPAAGSLQRADARRDVGVLGEERIGRVDRDVGGDRRRIVVGSDAGDAWAE